jgi:hypothetical protein
MLTNNLKRFSRARGLEPHWTRMVPVSHNVLQMHHAHADVILHVSGVAGETSLLRTLGMAFRSVAALGEVGRAVTEALHMASRAWPLFFDFRTRDRMLEAARACLLEPSPAGRRVYDAKQAYQYVYLAMLREAALGCSPSSAVTSSPDPLYWQPLPDGRWVPRYLTSGESMSYVVFPQNGFRISTKRTFS